MVEENKTAVSADHIFTQRGAMMGVVSYLVLACIILLVLI